MEDDMPPGWRRLLAGHAWHAQTIGRSDAAVYRLIAEGGSALFVKTEQAGELAELPGEIARLAWLAGRGIACPRILETASHAGRDWLLMSAVPGQDLASTDTLAPARRVEVLADSLRRLHALDAADCPFDHRLDTRLALARARMEAGRVDEDDLDDERRGRPLGELYRELVAARPASETLVVTHGDACMPNVMATANGFSGFVDCGRLGLADRYQDLALAAWSVTYNLGDAWVAPFFDSYGLTEPDRERLAYYCFLDEFF